MSFWHWIVVLMLLAVISAALFSLIYLAARAGVRSGMKGREPPADGGN